ncbi:phosphoribosyltransferase family protein [Okeanomitos corallinicola TIOX110]|uniref:Phosphoribosyltransferase family protein n=1 Tax=Okeanomitos corallinicola TIOX110 TaxID=3133117 RepID=A0ABZ2UYQ1_9CYAN
MTIFNKLPDLFYLGFYHPQYNYYEDCYEDNEHFNEYSHTILELKNRKHYAINFFLQKFKLFLNNEKIAIATVPPHTSADPSSGIRDLAKQLIKLYPSFSDAVFCLERFKDSHRNRTIDNHLSTIKVNKSSAIKDKKVILLDDVLTTGSSIEACKKLLLDAGAKEVKVIVLGKTMRDVEDTHDFIEQKIDEYLQDSLEEVYFEYRYLMKDDETIQDVLKEEAINEHLEVDEWANEQYSYLDTQEEYDYIEEEVHKRHEIIDEIYHAKLWELRKQKQNEESNFEHDRVMVYEYCQYIQEETHQVLDGCTCFSVCNPFIFYFRDW